MTDTAAELADAMQDAPDLCASCGTPLTDDEPYLCDDCTADAYWTTSPLAGEPWDVLHDPYYQPPDRYGISVFGVLLLATVLASLIALGLREVQAQVTTLRAPHAINGRIYEWPAIGTPAYSRSCTIIDFWEDGSARAYYTEDGALMAYDPDGDVTTGKQPGWYPVTTTR